MDSLYATGLAIGARVLVNSVIPYTRVLAAIGVFDGILLYHSRRPGTSSFDPTLNPYAAYVLRIVFDFLWSLSFLAIIQVALGTLLGIVLSRVIDTWPYNSRYRSSKNRSTKTKKGHPRPSDPLPPTDDLLTPRSTADGSLPSRLRDLNDLNADLMPAVGESLSTSELYPSGHFPETSTGPLPPRSSTSVGLMPQAGQSHGDLEVSMAEGDPPILIDDYQTDEDDRTPTARVSELPAASTQPMGDVFTAEMPTSIPDSQDATAAVDQSPNGPLLTLAPDQNSPQVAQSALGNQPSPSVLTQLPADTTQTSLLDVPSNENPIAASPHPAADPENAVPLPVLVTDNLTVESLVPISAITQTDGGSISRLTRKECKAKSNELKEQAGHQEMVSHRHEVQRKKAAQNGMLKMAARCERDRDEADETSRHLRHRAMKYDYRADNLDLPAQSMDVHSVDAGFALRKIFERWQQTQQHGEQVLYRQQAWCAPEFESPGRYPPQERHALHTRSQQSECAHFE